jgi:hypothetical protein
MTIILREIRALLQGKISEVGKVYKGKTTYTTGMMNEAALTPTEHLEAIVEAADDLHEVARQGHTLQKASRRL